MSSIGQCFRANDGKGVLIGYVMGGDPDPIRSIEVANSVIRSGADILELGVPFSDPIADGPSIQRAGVRALRAGTTPDTVLQLAKTLKETRDNPIALMSYLNPIYSTGVLRFLDKAEESRVDGIIIPDLPLEESNSIGTAARKRGIDSILLAAPSTPSDRLEKIAAKTSGFLYLVSVLGVTGARQRVGESVLRFVKRTKKLVDGVVPVAVGFGISRPEQAASIARAGADGVIIGSAIVNLVEEFAKGKSRDMSELEAFVRTTKDAISSVPVQR